MPPPIGAFLMPLYSILSWYGLCAQGSSGKYILPVAIIGWVWAGINILRTKRLDLGIVTFFFVILSALFERKYGFTRGVKWSLCVSSMLVAANYSLVIAFWKVIQKDLSKTQSTTWMNIFWTYCASMMVFWVCVAIKTYGRGESIGYTVEQNSAEDDQQERESLPERSREDDNWDEKSTGVDKSQYDT
ncbi:hypothetical protein ACHAWU_008623 [Discostella pseudostelligera]|uniref:Uncharacterized protein n=1 Tax=Discostella pseudostelligera TaxID=259834 RepID=A0ABD3M8M9_9STRA